MTPGSQRKGLSELSSLEGSTGPLQGVGWGSGAQEEHGELCPVWVQPGTGPAANSYTELGLGQALSG